jgi:hypothetical protein
MPSLAALPPRIAMRNLASPCHGSPRRDRGRRGLEPRCGPLLTRRPPSRDAPSIALTGIASPDHANPRHVVASTCTALPHHATRRHTRSCGAEPCRDRGRPGLEPGSVPAGTTDSIRPTSLPRLALTGHAEHSHAWPRTMPLLDLPGPDWPGRVAPSHCLARTSRALRGLAKIERVTGIEPASSAWKADALPLSYTRGTKPRPAIALPRRTKRGPVKPGPAEWCQAKIIVFYPSLAAPYHAEHCHRLARPYQASRCQASHCHAETSHVRGRGRSRTAQRDQVGEPSDRRCAALTRQVGPSQALPGLVLPRRAIRCRALPRRGPPGHTEPSLEDLLLTR